MEDYEVMLDVCDFCAGKSFDIASEAALGIAYHFYATKPPLALYRNRSGFWHVVAEREHLRRALHPKDRKLVRCAKGRGLMLYLEALGMRVEK